MVVTHNLMANFMSRQLNINTNTKSKAAERLGSGYKINRASDNAAGLAISEKMRGQIRGLERASENIQDGIAFSNVADGALSEVHSLIQRMRELSVRAANDTYVEEDREIIDEEINWLKKEINHIARDTEYNTYKIFCEDFAVELSDDVNVVKIFNAEDGNPNSPSTYGGIIVGNDIRVKWEDIDPNMVYIDAATNEMMFNKGEYTCTAGGYDLTITCEDGSQPPKIKASFSVDALASGLQVADKLVPWQDVVNEDGTCILNCSPIKGYFSFSVGDGEGVFYAPGCNDINEVINGINSFNNNHNRVYSNIYVGYGREQAVDIVSSNKYKVQVDNSISTAIQNGASLNDLGLKLVADTTGIHLLDMAGTVLSGSEKTWQDLGMAEWDTGDDISDTKTYTYSYQDGNYNISFNFEVLDETSMESVIDGINGAFKMESTEASNQTAVEETGTNINSVSIVSSSNQLSIYEQAVLGREFDVETDEFASENMTYDETANQFKLTYPATGTPELEYVSTSITGYSQIKNDSELYQKYLIAREVQALLSGDAKSDKSLTDIITAQNVTAENYLSETITINKNTMLTTPGINNGSTYPAAHMDFSGLGTSYELYDLLGTGFNSTCKTCNNHYSVMFVYGGTTSTSSEGYGYTQREQSATDYILEIDIKSMMDKGITTGEEFTKALIDVLDDSNFDFHYTQYAAEGSTLYVCDNRPQSMGTTEATFDTKPFSLGESIINITLDEQGSNRYINLSYNYNVDSLVGALANMVSAIDGEYVEDTVGGGYRKYDATTDNGLPRFNLEIQTTSNLNEAFYDTIMKDIADNSKVKLVSDKFAYINYGIDENPNGAIVSKFEFKAEDDKKFWIQTGANANEGLSMEWDCFSSFSLGLHRKDVLSHENAEIFIQASDNALEKISKIRSVFGAYTNRLEHSFSNASNTAENLQAAESRIRDTDMAEEMVGYSKSSILEQAANSLLAQANKSTQGVLQLLQ